MKLCPVCGALAPDNVNTCPICGAVLSEEVNVSIPVSTPSVPREKEKIVEDTRCDELIERIERLEGRMEEIENLMWKIIFGIASHFDLWEDIKDIYREEGREKDARKIEKIRRSIS